MLFPRFLGVFSWAETSFRRSKKQNPAPHTKHPRDTRCTAKHTIRQYDAAIHPIQVKTFAECYELSRYFAMLHVSKLPIITKLIGILLLVLRELRYCTATGIDFKVLTVTIFNGILRYYVRELRYCTSTGIDLCFPSRNAKQDATHRSRSR